MMDSQQSRGLYVIQVASRLTGMHPQTLRKYERAGFLAPMRHRRLRLYSEEDIALLKMIRTLVEEGGLNLAGLRLALNTRAKLLELKETVDTMAAIEHGFKQQITVLVDEILKTLETCAPAKAYRNRLTSYKRRGGEDEHQQIY